MATEVCYDGEIYKFIQRKISDTKVSIKAAIAWFTDPELEKTISDNHRFLDGLILNGDKINEKLDFKSIKSKVLYFNLPNHGLMHHKFCIIDDKQVLTGSYNWTIKARRFNKENLLLIDDEKIVNNFIKIYEDLKSQSTFKISSEYSSENREVESNHLFDLEKRFNDEIQLKLNQLANYNIGFLAQRWVDSSTPVIAAKRIVEISNDAPTGLVKLWEKNKLDLSFEESIIKKEFKELFDLRLVTMAKSKLQKLGYFDAPTYANFQNRYQD